MKKNNIIPFHVSPKVKQTRWNISEIEFLHQPDDFTGTFDNEKMQIRHEQQLQKKLDHLMTSIENEENPFTAMKILNKKDHLTFFFNNLEKFRQYGCLESAVLFLYFKLNAPFASGGDVQQWNRMFQECDKGRLLDLGESVSFNGPLTVYRGSVSGMKRSLCWTPDRTRAEQFANRWHDPSLGGGEIYKVDIVPDDIIFYQKQRHEVVLLLSPAFVTSANIRSFS